MVFFVFPVEFLQLCKGFLSATEYGRSNRKIKCNIGFDSCARSFPGQGL
jgi:hypothetical protein